MKDTLKTLVATCVENNVVFVGGVGTAYTIQDLIHATSLQTINTMYQSAKKQLGALETDSLFKTSNTTKRKSLELQSETLREVFEYKAELAENAKKAEALRKEKAEKLALLNGAKGAAEMTRISKLTPEQIDAEIAALENA